MAGSAEEQPDPIGEGGGIGFASTRRPSSFSVGENTPIGKNQGHDMGSQLQFYVGFHQPSDGFKIDRPLCFSVNRVKSRRKRFCERFVLDSGGFNEITKFGCYRMSPREYASVVNDLRKFGGMDWAAQQDFMCEEKATKRTGLTVREHQILTTDRLLQNLRHCDVIPVIQGREIDDYVRHAEEIRSVGNFEIVGVGTVCCRKSAAEIREVAKAVSSVFPAAVKHGFGVKSADGFESADSMAWSLHERMRGRDSNSWVAARDYYDAKMQLHNSGSPSGQTPIGKNLTDCTADRRNRIPL